MTTHQAGWYQDPGGIFEYRYWDGERWTGQVAIGGEAMIDPAAAAGQASGGAASAGAMPTTATAARAVAGDPMTDRASEAPQPVGGPTSHESQSGEPVPSVPLAPSSGGLPPLRVVWQEKPLAVILPALGVAAMLLLATVLVLGSLFGPSYDPGRSYSGSELAAFCAEGDMRACDRAFWTSPLGSDLEYFGGTCGGRLSVGMGPGHDIQWGDSYGPQGECTTLFGDTYGFFDRFRH